jgi:hypothetical protein
MTLEPGDFVKTTEGYLRRVVRIDGTAVFVEPVPTQDNAEEERFLEGQLRDLGIKPAV